MKKTIIYLLASFIIGFGFLQNSTTAFSNDCKITPTQAMERAKALCKKEKITYDSVLGPYFVLPHSSESRPSYLVYFTKGEIVTGELWIDACGKNENDHCFAKNVRKVNNLRLDSVQVKELFKSEKGLEVLFLQLVSSAQFWKPRMIPYHSIAWWLIDENGDCYYITLFGHITSFKELAESRKRKPPVKIIKN